MIYVMERKWNLTSREFEVLELICKGLSNPQIAKELIVSHHTVKAHVASIYYKTKINLRVVLALEAFKAGILQGSLNQV